MNHLRHRRCVAVLLLALAAPAARTQETLPVKGQRVFVCGHSFHMPIAPMLGQIATSAGIADHQLVGTQGIGGSTVTKHWEVPDPDNKVRAAIRTGRVDVLTLAPNRLLPDEAIDRFTLLLLEHNPRARITVQASWYPRDGHDRGPFSNAQRETTNLDELRRKTATITDKLRDQVQELNQKLAGKQQRQVVSLVPVGEAITLLRERVARGEVPGIAKQSDLFRDELGHGKAPIYVLNAYCHHAVIYGRSPVGLMAPEALRTAGLGQHLDAVNRALQEVAWQAVSREPASGLSK